MKQKSLGAVARVGSEVVGDGQCLPESHEERHEVKVEVEVAQEEVDEYYRSWVVRSWQTSPGLVYQAWTIALSKAVEVGCCEVRIHYLIQGAGRLGRPVKEGESHDQNPEERRLVRPQDYIVQREWY